MRAAGRPRSSTVASVIAFAVGTPAANACCTQARTVTNGSASQSAGSSGTPAYCSPSHNRSVDMLGAYHACGGPDLCPSRAPSVVQLHLVVMLVVLGMLVVAAAARLHERVEARVHLRERR